MYILPQIKGAYTGIAIIAVMHLYFKFTQPLFMQSVLGLKGLYESKMVQLYILGKPAEGDLKRPFKSAAGFLGGAYFFLISPALPPSSPLPSPLFPSVFILSLPPLLVLLSPFTSRSSSSLNAPC